MPHHEPPQDPLQLFSVLYNFRISHVAAVASDSNQVMSLADAQCCTDLPGKIGAGRYSKLIGSYLAALGFSTPANCPMR